VDFTGQTVLVTGAGRGLGEAYALLIASLGATVAVRDGGVRPDGTDSDPSVAQSVRDGIVSAGGIASAHVHDLGSRGGCVELITDVLNEHGKVDALIHSAGIVRYQRITETSDEEWERLSATGSASSMAPTSPRTASAKRHSSVS
jgi:NAD(P)-dependent dehydrogenase (short-subunit alcohol dehydrogenase family)